MKGIIGTIIVIAIVCAVFCSGCAGESGDLSDGDEHISEDVLTEEYSFEKYELEGYWTEISLAEGYYEDDFGTHGALGKLTITESEITFPAGSTTAYSLAEGDLRRRVISYDGGELLFRRIDVNINRVNVLFSLAGENIEHIYIKDSDLGSLPRGYVPAPADGEREPYKPEDEEVDGDALREDFINNYLIGEWTEFGSDMPWRLMFDDKETIWYKSDGTAETHEYSVSQYETSNDYRYISCYGTLYEFMALMYRTKVIDGRDVRVMFAVNEVTGGTEPELVMIFVKDEDMGLIPEGYIPGLYKDNVFTYRAPDNTPVYITLNALELSDWLGRDFSDTGIDRKYISDGKVSFNGYLFGEKITGTAYSNSICYNISIYSYDLNYDDTCGKFEKLFGEGYDSDIPYVAGDGYTIMKTFTKGNDSYTVIARSELPYIEIALDFKAKVEAE